MEGASGQSFTPDFYREYGKKSGVKDGATKEIENPFPPPGTLGTSAARIVPRKANDKESGNRCLQHVSTKLVAEALPPKEKQELMQCLAARLRSEDARLPEPRQFSREEIESWIREDEADLRVFRQDAGGCSSTRV